MEQHIFSMEELDYIKETNSHIPGFVFDILSKENDMINEVNGKKILYIPNTQAQEKVNKNLAFVILENYIKVGGNSIFCDKKQTLLHTYIFNKEDNSIAKLHSRLAHKKGFLIKKSENNTGALVEI